MDDKRECRSRLFTLPTKPIRACHEGNPSRSTARAQKSRAAFYTAHVHRSRSVQLTDVARSRRAAERSAPQRAFAGALRRDGCLPMNARRNHVPTSLPAAHPARCEADDVEPARRQSPPSVLQNISQATREEFLPKCPVTHACPVIPPHSSHGDIGRQPQAQCLVAGRLGSRHARRGVNIVAGMTKEWEHI